MIMKDVVVGMGEALCADKQQHHVDERAPTSHIMCRSSVFLAVW